MKIRIYELSKIHMEKMSGVLPDYVRDRYGRTGTYTIGATVKNGEKELLAGMCQFLVNRVSAERIVSEFSYVYVYKAYRRKGVGLALLEKMAQILKKSSVGSSITILVAGEENSLGYGVSMEELEAFIKEGEFLPSKDASDYWEIAERDMFAGNADLVVINPKKFVRRNI